MKKLISVLIFLSAACVLNAQIYNSKLAQISQSGYIADWVKFKDNKQLDPLNIFSYYKDAFGLNAYDVMKIKKQESDNINYTHYRFQQYYKGIPVRAGEYIIHAKDGKAISANGKIVTGINLNVIPGISSDEARNKAISYINAKSYMWENPKEEALLKKIKNDPYATYYPVSELMIADKKCSNIASNYKLVYKVEIYASKPLGKNYVFVDANTGEVLFTENRLMTTDVKGTAVTKYAGTQSIWTDSVSPGIYRLRNIHYGNGIETYDMNRETDYNAAVDFTDTDNYWNNINAQQDEAATDAHFGAEATYKYYFQKFGRLGFDNLNSKLLNYVHYDVDYNNAFWDGSRMTYGDGDGTDYSAFTSLDVTGHEITHAVDEHSANLVYQDESGALNEAFSDIFGTCIEFFADSANGDWNIGEDFDLTGGNGFRSMSDPKSDELPDTYLGQYWVTNDVIDNGGVHTNMGPLCYWFYLLSVGGSGTNDIGNIYNVTGIGRDSAANIAYRMLTVYLTPSSAYTDARLAAIQSAEDLYGACSVPVIQTSNAMFAIGVGFPLADNDLQMLGVTYPYTACGYSNSENISIQIKYNGCDVTIPAGDTIPVAYKADNGMIINDTIILSNSLNGGDTLNFTFTSPSDFSLLGNHSINVWVKYNHDNQFANDSILGYTFTNKLQQNIDVGVSKINEPVSSCHMTNTEHVNVDVKFYGCDSLAAGDTIVLAYRINGGNPIRDTIEIPHSIMPSDTFNHVFTTPVDFSLPGSYTIDAWTEYDADTMNTNDMIIGFAVKNPADLLLDTIGFETNINNLALIETTHYSHAWISVASHHTGTKGFQMAGGNPLDYIDIIEFPDGANTWAINEFLSAKINFCVNATDWDSVFLHFDLRQTDGGSLYTQYVGPGDYTLASNLRILVNGTQIGSNFNPTTNNSDPWKTHLINLNAYVGQQFTLTFETRNIAKDTSIFGVPFILDNAYIDNVCFSKYEHQSISDFSSKLSLGIYPNPFNDKFIVKFDADKQETVSLEITDMLGRTIGIRKWDLEIGTNRLELNLNSQPAGMYMLKLYSANGLAVKNIVKQ